MPGFVCENTSSQKCMTIRQCDADLIISKLDLIINKLESHGGIREFGTNIAANIIGNIIKR